MTREFSDHSPLLLINHLVDYGPTPFKFYNSRLLHKDFHLLVTSCWASIINGSDNLKSVSFKKRLQSVKNSIKSWRQATKIEESSTATALRNRLDCIDLKAKSAPLSPLDIASRTSIVNELSCLELRNIKDLKQKAKSKWAKLGDENSGYFHGIINNHINRSRINGLNILGSWVTDPLAIKNHVFNVFESKFKEEITTRPTFSSNRFNHLSSFLDQPFSNQEIKDAVWDCGGDKAPGPDGFTFEFIKKYWEIIGNDILAYVKEFEASVNIHHGCNSSFITLVPKVYDPIVIGDFRPISLIGCQYKIIAKVIAN
ncbi:hypothetical protein Tco_1399620 [Tanacetum coccineum]